MEQIAGVVWWKLFLLGLLVGMGWTLGSLLINALWSAVGRRG